MAIKREDILRVARTFLGTKFHHQGRLKGVGVDCIGLVVGVCKELEIPHIDYIHYSMRPDGTALRREIAKSLDAISRANKLPGDIAIFKVGLAPRHIGIITDVGIIHTYRQVGYVVEHHMDEEWIKKLVAVYRFRGIE